MTTTQLIFPFLISLLSGWCIVKMILQEEIRRQWLLHFSLAWGLGLGLSSFIGYVNFLVLDRFSASFQITLNFFALGLALIGGLLLSPKQNKTGPEAARQKRWPQCAYLAALLILFAPLYYIASFYPYGGWDAWAVWHFKSRFLLLSDDAWRNMFDPALWRSSPHYPLLLPLVNVWGWSFVKEPTFYAPMISSLLYTLISLTLLISSLIPFKKDKIAFLGACLLISLSFYAKTAISQYADIPLGYYLLASLVCIIYAVLRGKRRFALLGGIFIGFLSFCKPEGSLASAALLGLASGYLWLNNKSAPFKFLVPFWVGSAMALALPLTFYVFIAPQNMTMINGFVSKTDPSSWLRFKTILAYTLTELMSLKKWNGLWILLFFLATANLKRGFGKEIVLIPLFLASYSALIGFYYLMNTYFEIVWWMGVSLERILGSLLPAMLWWVVYALKRKEV